MNNIEMNAAIVTIAAATVEAAKFPGVRIEASATDEWTYDITTPVAGYDRHGVALEQLVVEVKTTVTELQMAYGDHGEGLGNLVLDFGIKVPSTR